MTTRRDGTIFETQPVPKKELPLDGGGIDPDLSADEIISIIRETREREDPS